MLAFVIGVSAFFYLGCVVDDLEKEVARLTERAKQLQPWQQRVVIEADDLMKRTEALHDFIDQGQPSHIDDDEWERLRMQCNAMSIYFHFLMQRIENFK